MKETHRPRRALSAIAAAGILVAIIATIAAAHETWFLPSATTIAVGQRITLDLTSGLVFPTDDFSIDPARVTRAVARLAGHHGHFPRPALVPGALRYEWTPATNGIATLGIELAPRKLELAPKLIEEYFAEIHASPAIRAEWDSVPAPRRWRELYRKHATTFVRVGDPGNDTSWKIPLGFGLEIVPQQDPTSLHGGDTLAVLVLRDGAPLAGFEVGSVSESDTTLHFAETDAGGRARVALPTAGRWLLTGTNLRRVHEKGLEWRSDFVTVTLGVR